MLSLFLRISCKKIISANIKERFKMADKKTDKKVKEILKENELDKVTGGCNPDYVTGTYDPDASKANNSKPKPKSNFWAF